MAMIGVPGSPAFEAAAALADELGALLAFDRILLPLSGGEVDAPALKLASMLLTAHPGEASLLHVIEVPFDRQLDMQDDASLARAEGILPAPEPTHAITIAIGSPT